MKTFAVKEKRPAPAAIRRRPYVHAPLGLEQRSRIGRILRSTGVQAKLTIGRPNDRYEQEADRVADKVMAIPDQSLQRQPENEEEEETLRTKSLAGQITPLVQRQEEAPEEEEPIQAKEKAGRTPGVTPNIESRIHSLKGGGQPLDSATRSFFESRFGTDFSHVRIHSDSVAEDAARSINARAYTFGRDIVFGNAEYAPHSIGGQRILAHELAHVVQQQGGGRRLQLAPAPEMEPSPPPGSGNKVLLKEATVLETEILNHPSYKTLTSGSKAKVWWIIGQAKKKPLGNASGQRNYYLAKLKLAITTKFIGTPSKNPGEYGCSPENEKKNRKKVEEALNVEKYMMGYLADLEERVVAGGTKKVRRRGQGGKYFYVDRSDPRNIRVQIKVKLNGKPEEVKKIKQLEDAIERKSYTKGYWLDIVFVDKSGFDVFEFTTKFCQWANSGNWASSPTTLSHEVHHALGLGDRYDYIESHAGNKLMSVPMRIHWFSVQMSKTKSPRDPYSKMTRGSRTLLAEDVCSIAFPTGGSDWKKCIEARKDLDPKGIPPI